MTLDEMTMTDLAAMFAMMGLLARGEAGCVATADKAYDYANALILEKKLREAQQDVRD